MDNKQKEQLKKGVVYGGLSILCALSLWLIFAPSDSGKTAGNLGLNDSIPEASTDELTSSKLKAYEMGGKTLQEAETAEEMGKLSDYLAQAEAEDAEAQSREARSQEKVKHSLERYEENRHLVSSFYAPDPYEEEREALQAEIDDLREELRKKDSEEEDEEEKQLRLMERSYQMASKYLPQGSTLPANAFAEAKERTIAEPQTEGKQTSEPAMEALREEKSVVSSLAQPMSDSTFIQEYGAKERHLGFHSLSTEKPSVQANTLPVVVDRTTTLQEGDIVALRLLEAARIKDLHIPRGTKLMALAKIEGKRMQLLIKSVEVSGQIMSLKLSAYDTSGQEGIYITGSEDVSALKEVGANIGGSMGTSFTFASSAKDQIISEAARGVMQGASQLLQKKLRRVKVTLKAGHRLLLVQTK